METTAIIELDRLTELTCFGKFEKTSTILLTEVAKAITLSAEAPCRPNIFKSFLKAIRPIMNIIPEKNRGVNKDRFFCGAIIRKVEASITNIRA